MQPERVWHVCPCRGSICWKTKQLETYKPLVQLTTFPCSSRNSTLHMRHGSEKQVAFGYAGHRASWHMWRHSKNGRPFGQAEIFKRNKVFGSWTSLVYEETISHTVLHKSNASECREFHFFSCEHLRKVCSESQVEFQSFSNNIFKANFPLNVWENWNNASQKLTKVLLAAKFLWKAYKKNSSKFTVYYFCTILHIA